MERSVVSRSRELSRLTALKSKQSKPSGNAALKALTRWNLRTLAGDHPLRVRASRFVTIDLSPVSRLPANKTNSKFGKYETLDI